MDLVKELPKEIIVERFSKKLNCGATVTGFREIVMEHPGYDDPLMEYEEEN